MKGLSLVKLDLQSNRLRKIEELEEMTTLEELYLSYNAIEDLSGVTMLVLELLLFLKELESIEYIGFDAQSDSFSSIDESNERIGFLMGI